MTAAGWIVERDLRFAPFDPMIILARLFRTKPDSAFAPGALLRRFPLFSLFKFLAELLDVLLVDERIVAARP